MPTARVNDRPLGGRNGPGEIARVAVPFECADHDLIGVSQQHIDAIEAGALE
jgi:hypothetical protein